MSRLQPISQVVQTPQELERKKRNGTARQVRQEKNSLFLVFCFLTFGMDRLGKIPRHQWKERLKISKLAKIAKLRKFTDVCIVCGGGGGGGGASLCPHHTDISSLVFNKSLLNLALY